MAPRSSVVEIKWDEKLPGTQQTCNSTVHTLCPLVSNHFPALTTTVRARTTGNAKKCLMGTTAIYFQPMKSSFWAPEACCAPFPENSRAAESQAEEGPPAADAPQQSGVLRARERMHPGEKSGRCPARAAQRARASAGHATAAGSTPGQGRHKSQPTNAWTSEHVHASLPPKPPPSLCKWINKRKTQAGAKTGLQFWVHETCILTLVMNSELCAA